MTISRNTAYWPVRLSVDIYICIYIFEMNNRPIFTDMIR